MLKLKYIALILFIASLVGCNKPTKVPINSQIDSSLFPAGYKQFVDSISSLAFPFRSFVMVDVTGDGIDDSCVTEISLVNGIPFVKHTINSEVQLIWNDTLLLKTISVSASLWGDENSYEKLLPNSGLFVATKYFSKVVGEKVSVESSEFSYFANVLHPNENMVQVYKSFKGHWIWYLDLSDSGGMIWNKKQNKFIKYWGS
jgi:hypothetical protein